MTNVKASEAAAALHMLAVCLMRNPDAVVAVLSVYFSFKYGGDEAKQQFLEFARVMPRPYRKDKSDMGPDTLQLTYESPALQISVWIERSKVCTLVRPAQAAEYDCVPLFTDSEESSLTDSAVPESEAQEMETR